jgi:hypothetical protein
MKRYFVLLAGIFFSCFILGACSSEYSGILRHDVSHEIWPGQIQVSPSDWMRGASPWFVLGDPGPLKGTTIEEGRVVPTNTVNMNVPAFSNIRIKGDFQVQILGTGGANRLAVYGSKNAISKINMNFKGDTLYLSQAKQVPSCMGQTIVRIAVNQLTSLVHSGKGNVEGIHIYSHCLMVTAQGRGSIYLAGSMNLRTLFNMGGGSVTIMGANTPLLYVRTTSPRVTNISGNVGLRSIEHHGQGDINVIGANSNGLNITADGKGKIGVDGIVSVAHINARDHCNVYINQTRSSDIYAYAHDNAHIGIAGTANNAYFEAFGNACISARNLCTNSAYVRTHSNAHINVSAGNKLFASADGSSSIYFFGQREVLSRFMKDDGTVIPIWWGYGNCPIQAMTLS